MSTLWMEKNVQTMSCVPILHDMSFSVLVHHLRLYPKSKLQAHGIEILSAFELEDLEPKQTHRNSFQYRIFCLEYAIAASSLPLPNPSNLSCGKHSRQDAT